MTQNAPQLRDAGKARGFLAQVDAHVGHFAHNAESGRATFDQCQLPANPPKEAL
jgi:hypothetical protein